MGVWRCWSATTSRTISRFPTIDKLYIIKNSVKRSIPIWGKLLNPKRMNVVTLDWFISIISYGISSRWFWKAIWRTLVVSFPFLFFSLMIVANVDAEVISHMCYPMHKYINLLAEDRTSLIFEAGHGKNLLK